jgi:hypothetical protein
MVAASCGMKRIDRRNCRCKTQNAVARRQPAWQYCLSCHHAMPCHARQCLLHVRLLTAAPSHCMVTVHVMQARVCSQSGCKQELKRQTEVALRLVQSMIDAKSLSGCHIVPGTSNAHKLCMHLCRKHILDVHTCVWHSTPDSMQLKASHASRGCQACSAIPACVHACIKLTTQCTQNPHMQSSHLLLP